MSRTQTKTKLLPPFAAVRLTWALTAQFPKGAESHNISVLADKVLKDIHGQAKGGPEQEYVDSTVAIIMAGMRTLDTIYKYRELNFDENEKLRSVALDNARENLEFGKKASDLIKSLPAMAVFTGTGVITASALGMEPLQLWMLGILLAGLSYWVNLRVVRRWHAKKQELYLNQDYERNLYFEQYVTRVRTTLTSMYLDIDRVHERVFEKPYLLEPPENVSDIVEGTLKDIRHTMCDYVHKHMKEGKITPKLWPLCEIGGKADGEKCDLWEG